MKFFLFLSRMSFFGGLYVGQGRQRTNDDAVSFATRPPDMLCFRRACAVCLRNNFKAYEKLDENGGKRPCRSIAEDNRLETFLEVKNRRGGGKEQIYAVQTNLDLNRWAYIGELVQARKGDQDWFKQLSNAS